MYFKNATSSSCDKLGPNGGSKPSSLGMVGWTKIWQKKTWPKVHFASFIVCIMLTHDDKMISIHS
jgi:hypothetical protein